MNLINVHLQRLYQGFLQTPSLWKNSALMELQQIHLKQPPSFNFDRYINKRLRLGQLAEQFVFNQLEQLENYKIIAENIQIQKDKQTIGELDAILIYVSVVIHLEIIYKFYLYDSTIGTTEVERWIGPNRKDSLIEKLHKLKQKQLPLLKTSECKSVLERLNINVEDISQRVCFKAQLFVPYKVSVVLNDLNADCVKGFYLKTNQLQLFEDCQFYIPQKIDWFLEPHADVDWMSYLSLTETVNAFLSNKRSPMIWIRTPDKSILKSFIVWW